MTNIRRRRPLGTILAALWALALASLASAQAPSPAFEDVTYILPHYLGYRSASDDEFARQVAMLRTRIGEGPYVKVGFSVYVWLSFDDWSVDINDPTAVRAALSTTIDDIDRVIARARAHDVPICLGILNAIRSAYDPVQLEAEYVDRRNMQWYSDNSLANGWMTYSRYSRRFRAIEEAYLRELGKVIANRMQLYPDTLVAAAGDGEEELSNAKTPIDDPRYDLDNMLLADYSPFAIAELRDWLRGGGLYAQGEAFAGQGYALASRYTGDATPADDTSGDGHTLNGDFGTRFTTWSLRYFDWQLEGEDISAIPVIVYGAPGWDPLQEMLPDGFDAPRTWNRADPWWQLWQRFRETVLWRHNTEFARWITTSVDPETNATVPVTRWFSYQIPADYLFGATPEHPNLRVDTSASAWWTADIAPYGSLGITAFNGYLGNGRFVRTLSNVAPHIAARNRRFGVLEWHPSVPPAPDDSPIWDEEMAVVEQYRPAVIAPFALDASVGRVAFYDTGFETALRRLVDRIKDGDAPDPWMAVDTPVAAATVRQPFAIAGWALDLGTIRGPGRGPGIDRVEVYATRSGSPTAVRLGVASFGHSRPDVAAVFGPQFANAAYTFIVRGLSPGTYDLEVRAYSRGVSSSAVNVRRVSVTVLSDPLIAIDTPREGATVRQPFLLAGWALDLAAGSGSGVDAVHVYAYPESGFPVFLGVARLGLQRPDVGTVFGAQFSGSGYRLAVTGLEPGRYRIVVFARSTVSGRFENARVVGVTIASGALMSVDAPMDGSVLRGPFRLGGWALELDAPGGTGVDAIHVWAIPIDGSAPVFLGTPALGAYRPDVAAVFGAQFVQAGYSLLVSDMPPPGDYDIAVFAHSALTGTFNNARAIRVTIQ